MVTPARDKTPSFVLLDVLSVARLSFLAATRILPCSRPTQYPALVSMHRAVWCGHSVALSLGRESQLWPVQRWTVPQFLIPKSRGQLLRYESVLRPCAAVKFIAHADASAI